MFFDNIFDINKSNKFYYGVSGLSKELNSIYVYDFYNKTKSNCLVITNSLYEATDFYQRLLNYTDNVLFFPMDDFITSEAIAISPELLLDRVNTLNNLVEDENQYIVVTNLMGSLRYLPGVEVWKDSFFNISVGDEVDREKFLNDIFNLGYEKESLVTQSAKVGVRGYVVDIFAIGYDNPIRIEFWGDVVDSIKFFDVETQKSISNIKNVVIKPVTEFLVEKNNEDIVKKQKYLKYYSDNVNSIVNYIDKCVCFYCDYTQIYNSYLLLRETILEYDKDNVSTIKTDYMFDIEDIRNKNEIFLMNVDNIIDNLKLDKIYKYLSHDIDNYDGNYENIKIDLVKYINEKKTVIICVNNKNSIKRICYYLDIDDIVITKEDKIFKNKINLVVKNIVSGFIYEDYVVFSENDFYNEKKNMVYKSKFKTGTKIGNINNISKGDYVVHESFGIGIYDELQTIEKNGIKKDYIRLIYAGGDVLYIPVEKIDRISKYSSKEGVIVKVNKLGGDEWRKKKARVRSRIEDIAKNLLNVSAKRELLEGFSFSSDDENQVLFESGFEYEETDDQVKATDIIKHEMEKPKPMDMLLCGDVGYGKTEVAFRAIFKAVNDGKQVAYLCPTTILSNQQYKNAISRFKDFPINIALLNRFVDSKKQKDIISNIKDGKIDILFGTHRILSDDIKFKDLGLLVIDEEQRFGVKHKEKIKEYKANIDVLTLSATPIPRTLQLSMSGIRSLALIETPPKERYPIQTYVLEENKNVIKDAIYKELARNGQIFILFNNIDRIESKVREIKELVPEASIDFAHGRMSKEQIESKMQKFIDNKFDILVCTTIIETGIDIPNVNTLIIIDADKFGLSQLYQIRGRIGRSNRIGYAYLMYDNRKVLNDIAVKRLNTIKEFTELGSGFKIAMRDLSIRGAGDILGSEQSGFIDTIGIELYLKMLKDAVSKLKGEVVEEEVEDDSKILIEVDTHISDSYTSDEDLKIVIHKMINEVDSYKKLKEVKSELEDRFGKITDEMEIYMYEEWIEKMAKKLEIEKYRQNDLMVDLMLSREVSKNIDGEKIFNIAYEVSHNFKLDFIDKRIHIILDLKGLNKHYVVYYAKLFDKILNLYN